MPGAETREDTKSLVKYAKPIVVSPILNINLLNPSQKTNLTLIQISKSHGRGKQGDISNTQDILNSILPPLQYKQRGQVYVETVLSTPATKQDVIILQRELDSRLQTRQARETGICPIREELYAQCFDELIRQITINCSHRGLLLVRVRDEMRMTIQAYQVIFKFIFWEYQR